MGRRKQPQDRRSAASPQTTAINVGPYEDCLTPADRDALSRATATGLDEETALLRVLIRRALVEGKPATQVAYLVDCLTRLLKARHVLTGKAAKSLDEALAKALDAIAAEMGATL
ncbi:MAG: hypothetical protein M1401_17375 [Chloroflexi bacterium]|nr:hypothetical protein [Chloroflexota bacterium]